MLHTLNKAWATILINQAIKDPTKTFLFVANDLEEYDKYIDLLVELDKNKNSYNVLIIIGKVARMWMIFDKRGIEETDMFDDILISHEIHDMMLKNFLSKHIVGGSVANAK